MRLSCRKRRARDPRKKSWPVRWCLQWKTVYGLLSKRQLNPDHASQPHLHPLREDEVSQQRDSQEWPIEPRERGESEIFTQRSEGDGAANRHDGPRHGHQGPRREALEKGDLVGANDVDDECLGQQALDKPAGLKQAGTAGGSLRSGDIPAIKEEEHDEVGGVVEDR